MNVQLIAAVKEDIPEISGLASRIWNEHYPDVIGREQVNYMLEMLYNDKALEKQMNDGQQFYLIRISGQNLGFISVSENSDTECFIHKYYVEVSEHRRGIGKSAFEILLELYPGKSFKLQVNRQNHKAINFYFKMGFVIERVADFDIGNGYFMNDFVMLRK